MDNYRQSDKPTNHQEAGYTILEAIIAMLIVTVLMSVVAPVIGFSVGTRVSAKRIELASQAARSYIDWVKIQSDTRGPAPIDKDKKNTDVAAPNTSSALSSPCTASTYCDTGRTLFCVDGDGNGTCEKTSLKDMIVQGVSHSANSSFKINDTTGNYQQGYALWIRVYRADGFKLSSLESKLPNTGINAIGGDPKYPLTTLTTEISPTEDAFNNLKNRLK